MIIIIAQLIFFVLGLHWQSFMKEVMTRVEEKYLKPIDEKLEKSRKNSEALLEQQMQLDQELDDLVEYTKKAFGSTS
jgi:hypothetical protein